MNLDDRFGLAELGHQPLVLAPQPFVFGNQGGVRGGLASPSFGRQSGQRAFLPLVPPGGQMRRVQAFAPQQGPELPGLRAAIGLAKHSEFIFGCEPPPHGPLRDGRVRHGPFPAARGRPPRGIAGRGGGRNSSRAAPSFRSAHRPACCSQHPCSFHRSTSLPSTVITNEVAVSPIIDTEGMWRWNWRSSPRSTVMSSTSSCNIRLLSLARVTGTCHRCGRS